MVHVDPAALGTGIDTWHTRKHRAARKSRPCAYCGHLFEHSSARNFARRRLGTRSGCNLQVEFVFNRIGHRVVPSFSGPRRFSNEITALAHVAPAFRRALWNHANAHLKARSEEHT